MYYKRNEIQPGKRAELKPESKPQNKTLRLWYNRVKNECGGIDRYIELCNEKDKKGKYTREAQKNFLSMLDKELRLEPKESTAELKVIVEHSVPTLPPLNVTPIDVTSCVDEGEDDSEGEHSTTTSDDTPTSVNADES